MQQTNKGGCMRDLLVKLQIVGSYANKFKAKGEVWTNWCFSSSNVMWLGRSKRTECGLWIIREQQ